MSAFDYHKPGALAAAAALLAENPDAKALAGGMTLLPTIKQDLAAPSALVDLSDIGELRGVRAEGGAVVIGAMTTHAEVAASADVRAKIPALASLAAGIGDSQVRHRGTIGGSLANNDPAADYPAAALALSARIKTSKREILAEEYFQGLFSTALSEDEIITSVSFPVPVGAAYAKFRQPASLYALVGVFVARTEAGARVAVTGAGSDGVFRARGLEEALRGDFSAAALEGVIISAGELLDDMHGSAEYRAALVVAMAKRAAAALS